VSRLALAMLTLASSASLRQRMAQAARRRVHEHLSWDQKGDQILSIYAEILARQTTQAGALMPIEVHP